MQADNLTASKPQAMSFESRMCVLSLVITLAGMPFGAKISGRFAYSNLFQIVGFIILMPEMLKHLTKKLLMWGFFLPSSMFLSMFVLALFYDDTELIKYQHVGFFTLMLTYVGYFVNRIESDSETKTCIEEAYKLSILPFFVYFLFMGIKNAAAGIMVSSFGFDDKSHTVFFCSFYAFLALKYLERNYNLIVSFIFMILALMTASRLVVFFLPFYLFMLFRYASETKNTIRNMFIITILSFVVIIIAVNANSLFYVYSRVTTDSASGSTNEHLDHIRAAFQLKFTNIFNVFLGAGPGNYGELFRYSEVNIYMKRLSSDVARKIPAHSSHFQIFLEFSIVMFIAYIWFLYRILWGNWKNRNFTELCCFIPLVVATTLYSTHNEVLYWMILLYLYCEGSPASRISPQ